MDDEHVIVTDKGNEISLRYCGFWVTEPLSAIDEAFRGNFSSSFLETIDYLMRLIVFFISLLHKPIITIIDIFLLLCFSPFNSH